MVTVGLAVTVADVVVFKPVLGDHTYELAPLAVRLVELPVQIAAELGVTVIVLTGLTVTVTVCVFTQLLLFLPVRV